MSTTHFAVFIGASVALSTELVSLESRIVGLSVVAAGAQKKNVGASAVAVSQAMSALSDRLCADDVPNETARLTIWMYRPAKKEEFERVWEVFGSAAWVEFVPAELQHKIRQTREYVEERIRQILPLLHSVSGTVWPRRKTTPFPLPLRNFSSKTTTNLQQYWYNGLSERDLTIKIKSLVDQFGTHKRRAVDGFQDDKDLIFKPAKDGECHGRPHPVGDCNSSYACGRFRYGVSLYPGFHYDVSAGKGNTIRCTLFNSLGDSRPMTSEKRTYINIFPNDHLLPERNGV
jgi:hypothetical protein